MFHIWNRNSWFKSETFHPNNSIFIKSIKFQYLTLGVGGSKQGCGTEAMCCLPAVVSNFTPSGTVKKSQRKKHISHHNQLEKVCSIFLFLFRSWFFNHPFLHLIFLLNDFVNVFLTCDKWGMLLNYFIYNLKIYLHNSPTPSIEIPKDNFHWTQRELLLSRYILSG